MTNLKKLNNEVLILLTQFEISVGGLLQKTMKHEGLLPYVVLNTSSIVLQLQQHTCSINFNKIFAITELKNKVKLKSLIFA